MSRPLRVTPRKQAWLRARWAIYGTRTLAAYLRVSHRNPAADHLWTP